MKNVKNPSLEPTPGLTYALPMCRRLTAYRPSCRRAPKTMANCGQIWPRVATRGDDQPSVFNIFIFRSSLVISGHGQVSDMGGATHDSASSSFCLPFHQPVGFTDVPRTPVTILHANKPDSFLVRGSCRIALTFVRRPRTARCRDRHCG